MRKLLSIGLASLVLASCNYSSQSSNPNPNENASTTQLKVTCPLDDLSMLQEIPDSILSRARDSLDAKVAEFTISMDTGSLYGGSNDPIQFFAEAYNLANPKTAHQLGIPYFEDNSTVQKFLRNGAFDFIKLRQNGDIVAVIYRDKGITYTLIPIEDNTGKMIVPYCWNYWDPGIVQITVNSIVKDWALRDYENTKLATNINL